MNTEEFNYNLPKELIAQKPANRRDQSRLLVYNRRNNTTDHGTFSSLPEFLRPGDCIVINKTKVIPARIYCKKTTGGKIELLMVKQLDKYSWTVLSRENILNRNIVFPDNSTAKVKDRTETGEYVISFENPVDINKLLENYGETPLPPYIKRESPDEEDKKRYQTVYAETCGSIAAPTAGLHFTKSMIETLKSAGIEIAELVMHIGWGTFKPIRSKSIKDHHMLDESYEMTEDEAEKINSAKKNNKRIIAVGTSVVRTLESISDAGGTVKHGKGRTNLFIYPGYRYKSVDLLVTNFHLPMSTPLLLVCAFAGTENILNVYREAIGLKYRFYSYGDAMLIV